MTTFPGFSGKPRCNCLTRSITGAQNMYREYPAYPYLVQRCRSHRALDLLLGHTTTQDTHLGLPHHHKLPTSTQTTQTKVCAVHLTAAAIELPQSSSTTLLTGMSCTDIQMSEHGHTHPCLHYLQPPHTRVARRDAAASAHPFTRAAC